MKIIKTVLIGLIAMLVLGIALYMQNHHFDWTLAEFVLLTIWAFFLLSLFIKLK